MNAEKKYEQSFVWAVILNEKYINKKENSSLANNAQRVKGSIQWYQERF